MSIFGRHCFPVLALALLFSGSAETPGTRSTLAPTDKTARPAATQARLRAEVMPVAEVLRLFDLKGFTTVAPGDCLMGVMGFSKDKGDERLLKIPFKAGRFDFSFSVMSKWYRGAVVRFGDYFVYYSRGHWLNSATMVATPDGVRRFTEKKVEIPMQFSRVRAHYADGTVSFYYNGVLEDVVDIPKKYRSQPVQVGFCGYNAQYAIRDVVLVKR